MKKGTLTVVGTGIKFLGHVTQETLGWIQQADKLLYAVADPLTAQWLVKQNASAESLPNYFENQPRLVTYDAWADTILNYVRQGLQVCVVFYGHPGVYAYTPHKVMIEAQKEGIACLMLPGISAEDCLFADLGVDPCQNGYQCFEATDFVIRNRLIDPSMALVLWQVGVIGNAGPEIERAGEPGICILQEALERIYGATHKAILYEAAQCAITSPKIQILTIATLNQAEMTPISTLYIPSLRKAELNRMVLSRLGMAAS